MLLEEEINVNCARNKNNKRPIFKRTSNTILLDKRITADLNHPLFESVVMCACAQFSGRFDTIS